MLATFIQKWHAMFSMGADRRSLLLVLKFFISEIEKFVDLEVFGVKRHLLEAFHELRAIHVNGNGLPSEIVFQVPDSTTVAILRQRIARQAFIQLNSFQTERGTHIVSDTTPVRQLLMQEQVSVYLTVYFVTPPEKAVILRNRSAIPSIFIGQSASQTFDLLMSLLKDGDINELAKQILDDLPTSPVTQLQIEQLAQRRAVDYASFLPLQHLKVFHYNFVSLVAAFPTVAANFERPGGFSSLVKAIPRCPDLSRDVVSFLDEKMPAETKASLSEMIYETLFPYLSAFNEEDFTAIAGFLRKFRPAAISREIAENAMRVLLLSDSYAVRSLSGYLSGKLPIAIVSFTAMIPLVTESAAADFYLAFAGHLDATCPAMVRQIREGWERQALALPALLQALVKLLERCFVPEADCAYLTRSLIDRFLVADWRDKDPELFYLAVQCLQHLQNDALLQHLGDLHQGRSSYREWKIDGDSRPVPQFRRTGLDNLGETCFLNATLQQFYAMAPLRNRIIEYDGDNAFMRELRSLFLRLYLGDCAHLSPAALVEQWTGWDGEPMNPLVQQDA
jgi:hypothetical protein